MRSFIKALLALVFLIQSAVAPAFADSEERTMICESCASTNLRPGDVVKVNDVHYVIDRLGRVEGKSVWISERVDAHGSSPIGASLNTTRDGSGENGGNGDRAGNLRLSGRDFSDLEDNSHYSDADRAKIAEIQAIVIDRINQETTADANATIEELKKRTKQIDVAATEGIAVLARIAREEVAMPDPMTSLLSTIRVATPVYLDEAGWQEYQDHPFRSDHKEELEKLRARLNNAIPRSPQQADAKNTGYVLLDQADEAYFKTDVALGDQIVKIAKITIDIATDIIPLTAIPKDFYRAVIGRDPRTGEVLANWERGLAAGLLAVGLVTLGASNIAAPEVRALATAAHVSEAEVTAASTLARDANGARYTEALVAEAKSKLTEIRALNPTVENATLKRVRGYQHLAWDEGKAMFAGKTMREEKFVRFFSDSERAKGSWAAAERDVIGKTQIEIKEMYALEHPPTQYVRVTAEPDTLMEMGYVAKNEWGGKEGTIQYFFDDSTTIEFGKSNVLGEVFK
jgi:hypothetical protein